jgi:hypothetical protein
LRSADTLPLDISEKLEQPLSALEVHLWVDVLFGVVLAFLREARDLIKLLVVCRLEVQICVFDKH